MCSALLPPELVVSDTQLGFGFSGRERTPFLRRLSAMMAPAAQNAGSVIDDEDSLSVARAVCDAFSHQEAVGGLTRAQIAERVRGLCPEDQLDARIEVFLKLGMLRSLLDKKHQQRYVLDPAAYVGVLVFDRIAQRGGVDELRSLLDRTADAIRSRQGTVDEVAAALEGCRAGFAVYANRLQQLVADASLPELVAERGFDAEDRLHQTAQELQLLVSDLYPQLDAIAWKLVVEALRYVDAAESLLQRVLADGGVSLNFDQLDPEEYLTAAREASLDQLAMVAAEVVFDPAAPWADAGTVIETFGQYRPRRPRRERPPDPPASPDADPVERIQRAAAEATKRRLVRADGLLAGSQSTDLTNALKTAAWPGAGRILADLLMLDSSADHPYRVTFSDALHVDAEAPITYLSPATLELKPASGSVATENELTEVEQEQAA
jgi:hypothetical protein